MKDLYAALSELVALNPDDVGAHLALDLLESADEFDLDHWPAAREFILIQADRLEGGGV